MCETRELQAAESGKSCERPWAGLLAAAVIVLAGVVAYHNSFGGPFIFDDVSTIEKNPTIRSLWPIWRVLSLPPGALTVSGRPVINLSLAVNYAISGLEVWSYHLFNLVVHLLVGLVLYGVVRRTLLLPCLRDRFGRAAVLLALATAVLWAVHPLQTESVTYVVQRAESIMGLFCLLTLYCVIRGASATSPTVWYVLAALACLLGMASKEAMATTPLVVFLYDRTFLAGSFKQAWRKRGYLYRRLAATWLLLAYLVVASGIRGGTAGLVPGLGPLAYARTQPGVILHYLRLCFWPDPLVLDYGWPVASTLVEILPGALAVGALLLGTILSLKYRPKLGFVGAWFFMMLAVTSSVVPVADLAFEHRMYLALAAVVVLAVVGVYRLWERWTSRAAEGPGRALRWLAPGLAMAAAATALGYRTVLRNRDYASGQAIWQSAVDNRPNNPRAWYNLGMALTQRGQQAAAINHFRQALRLKPDYTKAHNSLGNELAMQRKLNQAAWHYRQALKIKPDMAVAHYNLANILLMQDKPEEAAKHYQEALRLDPNLADAYKKRLTVRKQHPGP